MLYLIRGLPGSGKSTFAKSMAKLLDACWHEADHFFYTHTADGDYYNFEPTKLHLAHKACLAWTEDCMCDGCNLVVSNTFTTEKELKPYLALAEKYGYRVTSLIAENRHGNLSVHNVPGETLVKMKNRFSVKL